MFFGVKHWLTFLPCSRIEIFESGFELWCDIIITLLDVCENLSLGEIVYDLSVPKHCWIREKGENGAYNIMTTRISEGNIVQ